MRYKIVGLFPDIKQPSMSSRHICICGKKRGQTPITITVTQCPNKHEIETTGLESLTDCDKYQSSTNEQTHKEKKNFESAELQEKQSSRVEGSADDKSSHEVENYIVKDQKNSESQGAEISNTNDEIKIEPIFVEEPIDNTALDGDSDDNPMNKSEQIGVQYVDPLTPKDEVENLSNSEIINDHLNEQVNSNDESDGEADDSRIQDNQNQTVMYMTDVSLNTSPFLDNLFSGKQRNIRKSSEKSYQCEKCMMEIFVFGRHMKNCKYSFMDQNLINCLTDGNTILEAVGKISFPAKCRNIDNNISTVYSQLNSNIANAKVNSKNQLTHFYESTFRKLEAHVKKDQLSDKIKNRTQNIESTNSTSNQTKEILLKQNTKDSSVQLDDCYRGSNEFADICVQFTGIPIITTTRSIQFDSKCFQNKSKWYDTLLTCFGNKVNEAINSEEDVIEEIIHGISSIEISKYLKI